MGKKINEQLCLEYVLKKGMKLGGDSKRIIKKLSYTEFERENLERPDFIRYCPPANKHEKGTLIGIEHFRVDALSLQKKNRTVASTGAEIQTRLEKFYNCWKDKTIDETMVLELIDIFADYICKQEKATYNTYRRAFEYSIEKHLQKVDEYIFNLSKLAGRKYNYELGFLIEIHSEFDDMFLNYPDGKYVRQSNIFPIFADLVRFLQEKIDNKHVRWAGRSRGIHCHLPSRTQPPRHSDPG